MLTRPDAIVTVLMPCATLFSKRTWRKAQLLLAGAVLATGQRTVAQSLRVMGAAITGTMLGTTRRSTGRCGRPGGGPHPAGAAAGTL